MVINQARTKQLHKRIIISTHPNKITSNGIYLWCFAGKML